MLDAPNSIILDSFAGSGTTAHAVIAQNKEDGGNRKFILVEMEDYADKITAERVRRVIKGQKGLDSRGGFLKVRPKSEKGSTFPAYARVTTKDLAGRFRMWSLARRLMLVKYFPVKISRLYLDMARYVFYTTTGRNIDEKEVKELSGFIGETDEYEVYLLYKPNLEYLKTTARDLDKAKALAKGKKGKRRLVFAPAKYLDQDALDEFLIDFAQLPFGVYRM